jgi:hypothetical protein
MQAQRLCSLCERLVGTLIRLGVLLGDEILHRFVLHSRLLVHGLLVIGLFFHEPPTRRMQEAQRGQGEKDDEQDQKRRVPEHAQQRDLRRREVDSVHRRRLYLSDLNLIHPEPPMSVRSLAA